MFWADPNDADLWSFGLVVGAIWSLPIACASYGALGDRRSTTRLWWATVPVASVAAWVASGIWRSRETFLPIELYVSSLGYSVLYAELVAVCFLARRWIRWRSANGHAPSTPAARLTARLVACLILAGVLPFVVLRGGYELLQLVDPSYLTVLRWVAVLPLVPLAFLLGCGVLPHLAIHFAAMRRATACTLAIAAAAVATATLGKLALADSLPRGPGFGFPNIDWLGPATLGFATGSLGLQAAYLGLMTAMGYRLRSMSTQPTQHDSAT